MSTLILLYINVTELLAILNDVDTRIKGVQIEDHEIKQENLLMTKAFFLRDITCLTRMRLILKL